MLETGLRVAELTHLEVGDLWYGDEPVENLVVRPAIAKRNEERTIPVSGKLNTAIRNIQAKHWALDGCNYTAYAFYMNSPKEKLTTRSVERIIKNAAALGFRKIVTPHTLRHTFATRILAKSNTRIVQTLLGHKCLSTTQRYLHPSAETLKAAIDAAQ
jgi:site-specific recombinase XerD